MSDEDLKHLAGVGEEAIEHFGVKGMRWGVRKRIVPSTTEGLTPKKSHRGRNAALITTGLVIIKSLIENETAFSVPTSTVNSPMDARLESIKDKHLESPSVKALPKEKDGGLFNPDAKLDTSRIDDLGKNADTTDDEWWDW